MLCWQVTERFNYLWNFFAALNDDVESDDDNDSDVVCDENEDL